MERIILTDFGCARQAYIEVKTFIEVETSSKVSSLSTRIEDDLGCSGDDNYYLFEKFIAKYNLDCTDFDYSKHFLSEGELITPSWMVLALPIFIYVLIIRLLAFGNSKFFEINLFPPLQPTLDMTFGDMLTWYLAGKYCLRSEVRFKLIGKL